MKKSHGFLLHRSSFGPEVFQVWLPLALRLHTALSKRNQQEPARAEHGIRRAGKLCLGTGSSPGLILTFL